MKQHAKLLLGLFFGASITGSLVMCADPTEIIVDVYTELGCEKGPSIAIAGGSGLRDLGSLSPSAVTSHCAQLPERAGRVVLKPSGSKDEAVAFQIVTRDDGRPAEDCTAANHYDGCIVSRRQLRFAAHESSLVKVHLRKACLNKPCGDEETCVQGACTPAFLPDRCSGSDCDETALGERAAADGGAPESGVPETNVPDSSLPDASTPDVVAVTDAAPDAGLELVVPNNAEGARVLGIHASGTDLIWLREDQGIGRSINVQQRALLPSIGSFTSMARALGGVAGPGSDPVFAMDPNDSAAAGSCVGVRSMGTGGLGPVNCGILPLGVADEPGGTYVAAGQNKTDPTVGMLVGTDNSSCTMGAPMKLGYAERGSNGFLYVGSDQGLFKVTLPLPSGAPCSKQLAIAQPTLGVALSADGSIVCASTSDGLTAAASSIVCVRATNSTNAYIGPGPVNDLVFAVDNSVEYLYFAGPDGIYRTRVLGL